MATAGQEINAFTCAKQRSAQQVQPHNGQDLWRTVDFGIMEEHTIWEEKESIRCKKTSLCPLPPAYFKIGYLLRIPS